MGEPFPPNSQSDAVPKPLVHLGSATSCTSDHHVRFLDPAGAAVCSVSMGV